MVNRTQWVKKTDMQNWSGQSFSSGYPGAELRVFFFWFIATLENTLKPQKTTNTYVGKILIQSVNKN